MFGKMKQCIDCMDTKYLFQFHNHGGNLCEVCHLKRGIKRGYERQILYNTVNGTKDTRIGGRTDGESEETTVGERGVQETPHDEDKQVDRPVAW